MGSDGKWQTSQQINEKLSLFGNVDTSIGGSATKTFNFQ